MAAVTLHIKDLGRELRAHQRRSRTAILRGIERTLRIDADRWVQWSIRGGGMGGAPSPVAKRPKRPRQEKPKRSRLRQVLQKLGNLLGIRKRKGAKPMVRRAKPKDPCDRKQPPTYRIPKYTGNYAESWAWEMTPEGGIYYSTATPAVKAGVIEHGRRAAPIPLQPLAEWVRVKLGCNDPKKAMGVAIAISKTAAKRPRPGLKVLERAHPKIFEAAVRNVERELRQMKPGT